jgi:hypothetical protein
MKRFACLCVLVVSVASGLAVQADGYDHEILSQPGRLTTEAHDFNGAGEVVGPSQTPGFQLRPLVYRNGRFVPIDGLPTNPPILSLTGINDAGRMLVHIGHRHVRLRGHTALAAPPKTELVINRSPGLIPLADY